MSLGPALEEALWDAWVAGYNTAQHDYAVWEHGSQLVGVMRTPLAHAQQQARDSGLLRAQFRSWLRDKKVEAGIRGD